MDDLLREFLTETSESLDTVDNQLVRFEQDPNNAKILDNIFRLVHTIKGTCGFLGLPRLEALAHAGETLMGKFRDGMPVTSEAVSLILASIDRIKEILAGLEATEAEPEGTDQDLIVKLQELVERGMAAMSAQAQLVASAQAAACRVSAGCRRCTGGRAGRAGAADAGAAAASRRSVAGRTGARVPGDRDRGGARRRSRRFSPPRLRRSRPQRRCSPKHPPKRRRQPNRWLRSMCPRPTRSPTSRSASTWTRWNI